jgi:Thioesterase-like superfamily
MVSAFYVPEGGHFVSTELTRGPWDRGAQHAGPPTALIGRSLERASAKGWAIGRITFEVLRPVPLAPLAVEVEVLRPGRSVELLGATLSDQAGEPLIRATAWRLAERAIEIPPGLGGRPEPIAGPEEGIEKPFFETGEQVGYHTAMEYRFISGGFLELGPARVWMRMRHPLVEGEQPSPLQRLLIAADSGNGVSATLDLARFIFINVDLTVHVHRMPAGEWVCLDAVTIPEPNGIGLADTVLHDQNGPVGRALQTLLIREREPPAKR